jgi:hypothetical protein
MPRKPLPSAATPASSRAHPTGRAPAKMSRGQARPALVNRAVGLVWAPRGRPRVAFRFTITRGKIAGIDLLADRERLRRLDLTILSD